MISRRLFFLAVLMIFGAQVWAQSFVPGLVGYWKLDGGSGVTIADELNTTEGTLENSVGATWAPGFTGSSLDFSQTSGAAAYARFPGNGVADINGSFTISVLIKGEIPTDGEQSIISKGVPNETTGGWYHLSLKNSAIRFMIWDGSDLFSPEGVFEGDWADFVWDANEWHHIVCVRDALAETLTVYLNGHYFSELSGVSLGDLNNDGDLTFGSVAHGATVWDSNYKGALDEVQLYNVALSEEMVDLLSQAYGLGSSGVENQEIKRLTIAPNPVNDELVLHNVSDISRLEIYNLAGVLIKTIPASRTQLLRANIADFSIGTYIVKGYDLNNGISIGRFTKW